MPVPASGGVSPHPSLARNAVWATAGQVLRAAAQAVYFVLIARALGAREYGAYVGVLALVAVAAPLASFGSGNLLIMHVARRPESFPRHWGKALVTTFLSGAVLLGLVTLVGALWLPPSVPLALVLVVGAADLVFVRLVDISGQAYQAHQRMARTALLQVALSTLRLIAALVLVASAATPDALQWGMLYLVSAGLAAGLAVLLVHWELGPPQVHLGTLRAEVGTGALFSIGLAAQTTTNDVDKVLLARLGTLEATGVYAAAYRLVDLTFLPVGSLLMATYARFFQRGVEGLPTTAMFGRRLTALGACYGALASVGLYALAPLLPRLLGPEYGETVPALRWLALLPLLKTLHYFGADALTGAGHQGTRTVIQIGIALVNVLLNVWLIPLYSWRGAAAATLLADGLMAAVIWGSIRLLVGRAQPAAPAEHAGSAVSVGRGR